MLRTPPAAWTIPVLETDRLRLRPFSVDDYSACCTLWSDPVVTRFIGGKPSTPEETWSRLLRNAGHWSMLGFGALVIEEKSTGDFVGEVGLSDYHRAIDPPLTTPEIGWVLSPAKHGQGYATEAVQALLDWGSDRFIANEVSCLISPGNAASLRVAAKCGFILSHPTTFRDAPTLVLTRHLTA